MNVQNKVKEVLEKDPIAQVEVMLGKRHEEMSPDEKMLAMAMFAQENKQKETLLKEVNDTYFNISWKEFKQIAEQNGFVVSYQNKFNEKDEEIILCNEEYGIVLFADSYNGKKLNTAEFYAQVCIDKPIEYKEEQSKIYKTTFKTMVMTDALMKAKKTLSGCSSDAFIDVEKGIAISYDCREGFVTKLNDLKENFKFKKEWTKKPFMWFLNYDEKNKSSNSYKEITNEKIKKCKEDVQKIFSKINE